MSVPVDMHLPMNALLANTTYQTMRVIGMHSNKFIHILIDSGSTHNFLDLELAKKLGYTLEAINLLCIVVANGINL